LSDVTHPTTNTEIGLPIEVLSAHCTASDDDIRAAAKEHHQALRNAEVEMLGVRLHKFDVAAKLRRLRR
jgi:hypothetical protein